MKLVDLKCKSCGATIKEIKYKQDIKCEYCGTCYVIESLFGDGRLVKVEDAKRDLFKDKDETKANPYIKGGPQKYPPKPQINCLVLIILLCINVVPGLFYYILMRYKQIEWKKAYFTDYYLKSKRPKTNILLAILLYSMFIFPGLLYSSIIESKQITWDKVHKKIKSN